jgi:hypothetical protein
MPDHSFERTLRIRMSHKHPEASNVLPFIRAAKPATSVKSAIAELEALLEIYDRLIALLREGDNEGLDTLTDSMVSGVVNCRAELTSGMTEDSAQHKLREMRAGLHEMPQVLRALLPGLGARLGESLEHKLGIQFFSY